MSCQRRFCIFDAFFYVFAREKTTFDAWEESASGTVVIKMKIDWVGDHKHYSLSITVFHNILFVKFVQRENGVFMVVEPKREPTDITIGRDGLPVGLCVGAVSVRLRDGSFIKVKKVIVQEQASETEFLIAPYGNASKSKKSKKRRNIKNINKTCKTKSSIRFEGDHPVPFYKKGRW